MCRASYLIDNIRLMKEWAYERNKGLNPKKLTLGSHKRVWWRCEKGHEWEAPIYSRTNGNGCPYCAGKSVVVGTNDLATLRPDLAKEWHPIKNGELKPSHLTLGSHKRVWWRCEKGHEWEAPIYSRTNGNGCPYCSGKSVVVGTNDLATLRPDLAKEWHPIKNGELKQSDVALHSNKRVWWKCEKGHEWEATVNDRSRGRRCPVCFGQKVLAGENDLETLYPDLAKEWHPIKNGELYPSDVRAQSNKRVWWKCEKGHEWQATIYSRVNGRGCPECSRYGTSFPEQAVYYYLSKIYSGVSNRYLTKNKLEVDIYIPFDSIQIGIEYDGFYYHNSVNKKEFSKNKKLQNEGITLIRMKECRRNTSEVTVDEVDGVIVITFSNRGNYRYLNDAISKLIMLLNQLCNTNQYIVDVNIQRDRLLIEESYKLDNLANSLDKKYPNLAKEWHPTKNHNLTPDKYSPGSHTKVWWKCEMGHEWVAEIKSRVAGVGCPFCSGHRVLKGFNDLETLYPDLAKEWHSEKNGSLNPSAFTAGSDKKVWWKCEMGHEWEAAINERVRGRGCPFCSGRKVLKGYNDLGTLRRDLLNQWNYEKNGDSMPSDFTLYSHKKVWWICGKGHEWVAEIASRSNGAGCPICAMERRRKYPHI